MFFLSACFLFNFNPNGYYTVIRNWLKYISISTKIKYNFVSFPPVLRFVGPTDNIYSCSFVQMLEQRLENAYDEAQDKVLETYSRLTVEVLHGFMEAVFSEKCCQVCRIWM